MSDMRKPRPNALAGASLLVYGILLMFAVLEQWGRTTNDTKTPLIERPGAFLHEASTLWDPMTNFGELQNQAYGYLFPQGPFYLLCHLAHVPPWLAERFWAVGVIIIGCEGARLLARSIGLQPWAAWIAGMAYGLNPRIISQVAVRSGEVLPTAVLPWVALPIVLALTGRIQPRRAALFSAVAFMFSGAVNGTATGAGLPLVVILIVWGIRRGLARWSLLGWWAGLVFLTSFWWTASLLKLNAYSPPFFDYVEDARATTETTGYEASLRGLSNWVNYTFMGNRPNWPAGFDFATEPALVVASGALAAVGVIGLVTFARPWRTPIVISAGIGLCCLTIAHTSGLESPLAPGIRDLLDGPFALLRNVSKADSLLRLPIALGFGSAFARVLAFRRRSESRHVAVRVGLLVALVLSMAEPAVAMNLRTPGWTQVPGYWQQVATYMDHAPGKQRSWLVPGSGFALQTWGWTVDEPFQSVATTPWVSRSQVPLAPPQTIRILSNLEEFLETGSGSPNLGKTLGRLGLGYVIVRHDLDPQASESTTSSLVSIALARSRGVERVKTFGTLDFGPALEVFRVTSPGVATDVQVRPLSKSVTVAGASSDVLEAVGEGLIGRSQPAVVQGDDGWERAADVAGDTYRLRERNFGRVHDAEGPVLAPGEPRHGDRVVTNYPANTASKPLHAAYDSIAYASASSSQAFTDGLGKVLPESAPYSAVDKDPETGWRSAYYERPLGQWLDVRFKQRHPIRDVGISSPVSDSTFEPVLRWRVTAGKVTRLVDVDPFTGEAHADLGGVSAQTVRITVAKVKSNLRAPVSIQDIQMAGLPSGRSLVMPEASLAAGLSYVFSAHPETRACITTLLGPDCDLSRRRSSEESSGIDRTIHVPVDGTWQLDGTAIARARPGTAQLLNPLGAKVVLHASSTLASDPTVSVRMAYDGAPNTSWIADPADAHPKLVVDWSRPRTIDRISVAQPAAPAVSPTVARLHSKAGNRTVKLGEFSQFKPLRTNHLAITFSNNTRAGSPIGLSGLSLSPAKIDVPFAGADRTGSVCGYGPVVHVDGKRYLTRVDGFMGDVVSAGPLNIIPCSGPIRMTQGMHRFRLESTEQFQPVSARLTSTAPSPPASDVTSAGSRTLSGVTGSATQQEIQVGRGEESILSTTRNFNRGWVASLGGKTLPVLRVDGWAQGWRLPAGPGGQVVIRYAPQTSYLVTLFVGLAVAGVTLLIALLLLLRTRLRPGQVIPDVSQRRTRPGPWWLAPTGVVLLIPIAWVLGGLPAAAAVLVGMVVGRRFSLLWAAFALLLAAPALAALQLTQGPQLRFDVADALAGVGFVLALMSMIDGPLRSWFARPVT